jgi:hypothetical protein
MHAQVPDVIVQTAAMASPDHTSFTISSIPGTAVDISSTRAKIALEDSMSEDISQDMKLEPLNPPSPQSPPTYPVSIEGRHSSEGGSIPNARRVSDNMSSTYSESMHGTPETVSEHDEATSPERPITNADTTSINDAIEDSNNDIQPHAAQSAPKFLQKEWRPFSLTLGFLLVFMLFQAAVLAAIEVMHHYSIRNTGLATVTDHDPASKTFVWAYLPIIIALLIALAWASIALETARITPWRLLSTKEGANLDIIFTKYLWNPFSAPFRSLRHIWRDRSTPSKLCSLAILCSSVAHLVSFLVLPPLQASLMSVKTLDLSQGAKYCQMPAFNASRPILNEDRLGELYLKAYLSYQGLPIAPNQVGFLDGLANK